MLTLYKNIKDRREALGMTKVELASRIGYERSMITKVEQGKVDLTQSKIAAFAEALQTTPAHLMGWDEEETLPASNIRRIRKTNIIPLIGTIACGNPSLAIEDASEYVSVEDGIHADFALRCKGDSMINARIFDGDIVYIKKQPMVENGEIAAVVIGCEESEATLKRVYVDVDKIRLVAENPMYKDIVYYQEDMNQVKIVGKAIAFVSEVR